MGLHRALTLGARPHRPRWQWGLMLIMAVTFWYLFQVWRQLYRCYRWQRLNNKQQLPRRSRQWRDLTYLGLWIGADPIDYFRFKLHRFERARWSHFIFVQQQPTWHRYFSVPSDAADSRWLADKYECEARLRDEGIGVVATVLKMGVGQRVSEADLLCNRSFFIKPCHANAMRGCMLLSYQKQAGHYQLRGKDFLGRSIVENQPEAILAQIHQLAQWDDVLIQNVLVNSAEMSVFCRSDQLVTIRVVSCIVGSEIELALALLEVESGKPGVWCLYSIDIDNGCLVPNVDADEPCMNLAEVHSGRSVPCWASICQSVKQAHALFPALKTIAWDLCVTDSGPCLIEGNSDWAIGTPQRVAGQPLLETRLFDAYTKESGLIRKAEMR